jgi:hypothetical protein
VGSGEAGLRPLAALTVVAAALIAAAPASAAIVPQRGIDGIRLGMTVHQVRTARGAPDAVIFSRHPIIGRTRIYKYGLTYATFECTCPSAKVLSIRTASRRERTSRGIGIGSPRAAVAAKVPTVRCRVEFGLDHCYVGRFVAGKRVTDFRIGRSGRVVSVVVGFVID